MRPSSSVSPVRSSAISARPCTSLFIPDGGPRGTQANERLSTKCANYRIHTSEPIARQNGCSVVRTYCGHGINDLFHCTPNVPHYAKNKAIGTMKPGMTFTIEPVRVSVSVPPNAHDR